MSVDINLQGPNVMKPKERRKTASSATKEGFVDALREKSNEDAKENGSRNLAMLERWLGETPKEEPFHVLDLGQDGQVVKTGPKL